MPIHLRTFPSKENISTRFCLYSGMLKMEVATLIGLCNRTIKLQFHVSLPLKWKWDFPLMCERTLSCFDSNLQLTGGSSRVELCVRPLRDCQILHSIDDRSWLDPTDLESKAWRQNPKKLVRRAPRRFSLSGELARDKALLERRFRFLEFGRIHQISTRRRISCKFQFPPNFWPKLFKIFEKST